MDSIQVEACENKQFAASVRTEGWDFVYRSAEYDCEEDAKNDARRWLEWRDGVADGNVDSIYYILVVPETWAGPPAGAHAFSGLHYKIGRTRNVEKRLRNLQTGTSGELIVNALEPGGPDLERLRHRQFAEDRRSGEWFSASPRLCQHVFDTWRRNNLLPKAHQNKMAILAERIDIYREMRKAIGGTPDMVNPSLNEKWHGKVFVDLVYSRLLKGDPSS
ncbi:MAG TPA: GIY-YIG nuclease family protein [Dehalococcoidia bacterium]|nr:GIY-YIG nuclease family protein [Dehalococcoidia bacterium]